MKKRSFLAPLAVSIAGLLGGLPVPSHAAIDMTTKVENSAASSETAGDFVLNRSGNFRLAQDSHESHASHASHESHESHSSHVSGY